MRKSLCRKKSMVSQCNSRFKMQVTCIGVETCGCGHLQLFVALSLSKCNLSCIGVTNIGTLCEGRWRRMERVAHAL